MSEWDNLRFCLLCFCKRSILGSVDSLEILTTITLKVVTLGIVFLLIFDQKFKTFISWYLLWQQVNQNHELQDCAGNS